jgi:hypothetical protein
VRFYGTSLRQDSVFDHEPRSVDHAVRFEYPGKLRGVMRDVSLRHVGEDRPENDAVDAAVGHWNPDSSGLGCAARIVELIGHVVVHKAEVRMPCADVRRAPVDRFLDDIDANITAIRTEDADDLDGIAANAAANLKYRMVGCDRRVLCKVAR